MIPGLRTLVAATVLALLTTLTLSPEFIPSAGAQTTTCGAPDLGGRVEVWSTVLTVGVGDAGTTFEKFGYSKTDDYGELSDESFQLDNETVTVTEIFEWLSGLRFSVDKDVSLLPSFESMRLHFCDSAVDFSDGTIITSSKGFHWQSHDYDWSSVTTIHVALSFPSNSEATGHPSIEGGRPVLGRTLTAGRGTIADENGLDNASYSYQWVRIDGANDLNIFLNISDAVGATYTVTSEDVGKSLKVVATFTDDLGYPETPSSNPIGPVGTALTCGAPDLGGRTEVWSATLTVELLALPGGLEGGYGYSIDSDGELSDTSFQINRETVTVTGLRELGGGIILKLDVDPDLLPAFPSLWLHFCDVTLNVNDTIPMVNGVEWPGSGITWESATTIVVALSKPANSPATGTPSITGTPRVGATLTASTADISDDSGKPSVFEYQWVRVNGSNRTNIGAGQRTYRVTDDDEGSHIQVEVKFTDDLDYEEGPLRSASTDIVTEAIARPPGSLRIGTDAGSADERNITSTRIFAQEFSTGSNENGYTLTRMWVSGPKSTGSFHPSSYDISIWSADGSGNPGVQVFAWDIDSAFHEGGGCAVHFSHGSRRSRNQTRSEHDVFHRGQNDRPEY